MPLHKEINFEAEICQHLSANDWLYAEGGAANYDRALALYPADVLAWLQTTQSQAWEILIKKPRPQSRGNLAGTLARPA